MICVLRVETNRQGPRDSYDYEEIRVGLSTSGCASHRRFIINGVATSRAQE